MKLPMILTLELSAVGGGQTSMYETVLEFPGNPQDATIAMIGVNPDGHATVVQVEQNGLSEVRPDLRERFLVRLFAKAYAALLKGDGAIIEWTVSDITPFIQSRFDQHDAATLTAAMSKLIDPAIQVADVTRILD